MRTRPAVSLPRAWRHRESGRAAVANIGTRPTFEGQHVSVEVHLLDFEGDLYDQRLRVTLNRRLRGERRFDTVDELRRQIAGDIEQARSG